MNGNKSSDSKFWIVLLLLVGVPFLARRLLPLVWKILLVSFGIVAALVGLVIFLVIYFSKKSNKEPEKEEKTIPTREAPREAAEPKTEEKKGNYAPTLTLEQMRILSKGRTHLTELRALSARIANINVRKRSEDVCNEIEKILNALQTQPEDISRVRQFFNYYLPTLGNILLKYLRIEEGGAVREDTTVKVMSCLREIQSAMEKQHAAIYDNDLVDLTVEMEALTMACKRDGLLVSEDFTLQEGDRQITLTL